MRRESRLEGFKQKDEVKISEIEASEGVQAQNEWIKQKSAHAQQGLKLLFPGIVRGLLIPSSSTCIKLIIS